MTEREQPTGAPGGQEVLGLGGGEDYHYLSDIVRLAAESLATKVTDDPTKPYSFDYVEAASLERRLKAKMWKHIQAGKLKAFMPGKIPDDDWKPEPGWMAAISVKDAEADRWFEECGIAYRISAQEAAKAPNTAVAGTISVVVSEEVKVSAEAKNTNERTPPKRIKTQISQEEEILQRLAELNYDPLNLPKHKGGRSPGAKGIVKQSIGSGGGWTRDVFRKAWERLREKGLIKDAL